MSYNQARNKGGQKHGISTRRREKNNYSNHIVPCSDDGFHVQITGKECSYAIGNDLHVFDQYIAEIPDDRGVVSDLETGGHSNLVASSCDHLLAKAFGDHLISKPAARWPRCGHVHENKELDEPMVRMNSGLGSWCMSPARQVQNGAFWGTYPEEKSSQT
jgi:hypothetical protein